MKACINKEAGVVHHAESEQNCEHPSPLFFLWRDELSWGYTCCETLWYALSLGRIFSSFTMCAPCINNAE
jgi:hypothetical protein